MLLNALQEILEVEQIMEEQQGLQLTEANIELVLDEIRPYLVGEIFFLSSLHTAMLSGCAKHGQHPNGVEVWWGAWWERSTSCMP